MKTVRQQRTTLLALLLALTVPLRAADKPNIIILLVDDMGWANIGCYGGMVETPNLCAFGAPAHHRTGRSSCSQQPAV